MRIDLKLWAGVAEKRSGRRSNSTSTTLAIGAVVTFRRCVSQSPTLACSGMMLAGLNSLDQSPPVARIGELL